MLHVSVRTSTHSPMDLFIYSVLVIPNESHWGAGICPIIHWPRGQTHPEPATCPWTNTLSTRSRTTYNAPYNHHMGDFGPFPRAADRRELSLKDTYKQQWEIHFQKPEKCKKVEKLNCSSVLNTTLGPRIDANHSSKKKFPSALCNNK